jgi:non-ribosomal peptide synthetase component E (peptide arylation enzyme)
MIKSIFITQPHKAAEYRAKGFWKDRTVYERLRESALVEPGKTAIIDSERRFTYADVLRTVDTIAGNLLTLDLPKGSVVAVQCKNAAELPLMHMAAQRVGLLYLPLHDSWRETEVEHTLSRSEAKVLVIPGVYRDFDHGAMIQGMIDRLPLKHVFVLDGKPGPFRDFAELLKPHSFSTADLDGQRADPDHPATVMLSGGTTSLSKISLWSSNNLLDALDGYAKAVGYERSDVTAAIAPAGTGATGYVYGLLAPLIFGGTSVILPRWKDPEDAIRMILDYRCSHAIGIPTQLTMMVPGLQQRKPEDFSFFKVFTNAGAPLTYETGKQVEHLMGCKIQTLYGATDAATAIQSTIHDPQEKRLGTAGSVVPGFECMLWDAEGREVPEGEPGEVVWRGPSKSWTYLNDFVNSRAVFTADGFYRSGDLGQFDKDGYLRIVGRIKDMVLRGGRNISPRTIEEPMMTHPAVLEFAVAAMPDPVLGERACAFAMLKPGKSLTFDEMIAFLTEAKLAVWQLPERLEIVEDMPRSTGGKIAKAQLTAMVAAKLKAEGKIK